MPRLLLPPLSADAAAYFESIIGRASGDFDVEELNLEQLEQLLVVLEGETEHLGRAAANQEATANENTVRAIADLAATLTRALADRQGPPRDEEPRRK